jgi:signal transduction histidine kinase
MVIRITVLTSILVVLSALLTWVLGLSFVGHPLKILSEKAKSVGSGDLSTSVRIRSHDELSELEVSMNQMCEQLDEALKRIEVESEARIATLEQLRHADRLKTVGRLASGIAHELGTPLNVVSGRAGMIVAGKLDGGEIVENAKIIKQQVVRIEALIRQLLDFARRNPPTKKSVDLLKVIRETADLLAPQIQRRKAQLTIDGGRALQQTRVYTRQVQQVLMNLILNAVEAMPEGGKVEIGVRPVRARPPAQPEMDEGNYICVDVKDNGEGISEENLSHIFEPFFTTKDVGQGTGLGLSIAYGMIQEHGGWIDVASKQGQGSCFSIYFPLEPESCAETS